MSDSLKEFLYFSFLSIFSILVFLETGFEIHRHDFSTLEILVFLGIRHYVNFRPLVSYKNMILRALTLGLELYTDIKDESECYPGYLDYKLS